MPDRLNGKKKRAEQTVHLDQRVVYVLCSCGAIVPIKHTEEAKGVILPQLAMPAMPEMNIRQASGRCFILPLQSHILGFTSNNLFKS